MVSDLFRRAFWTSDVMCGALGLVLAGGGAVLMLVVAFLYEEEALAAREAAGAAGDRAALIERVTAHYEQLRAQTEAVEVVLDGARDAERAAARRIAILDTRAIQVSRLITFGYAGPEGDAVFTQYQREITALVGGDTAARGRILSLESQVAQQASGTRETLVREARARHADAASAELAARRALLGGGLAVLLGFLLVLVGVIVRRRLDELY